MTTAQATLSLLLLLHVSSTGGFTPLTQSRRVLLPPLFAVEERMVVGTMSGTHDEERALLRYTLSGHLNRTYIPHEAHDRIATLSSDIYVKER